MKKNIIILVTLLNSAIVLSQVGINTENPKTTLDVRAKRDAGGNIIDNTQFVGLQVPSMTRAELTNLTSTYGTDQKGALVYITDISGGTATGQRINITALGYYYFDGTLWQALNSNASGLSVVGTSPVNVATASGTATVSVTRNDLSSASSSNLAISPITITNGNNAVINGANTTIAVNNTAPLWNASQLQGVPVSATAPSTGMTLYYNGTQWIPKSATNVDVYGAQLKIPPHASAASGSVADWTGHSNTSYDTGTGTDKWNIISKSSTSFTNGSNPRTSKMMLVYEYQGTPFNTTDLYPIMTCGNNSSYPDVYVASFVSLVNVSGKTQLTVSVARIDYIGTDGAWPTPNKSDWAGTFLMNLLLAKKG